jgi:membrane protein implicated in regulation of membrane protease activity
VFYGKYFLFPLGYLIFLRGKIMANVFIFCSVFGGTILMVQTLLAIIGFGLGGLDVDVDMGDGDAGGAVGHSHAFTYHIFKVISFRTMIAGVTFFGLAGWAALVGTGSQFIAILVAVLAAMVAVFAVYFLYRWINAMRYQGNVSSDKLVGATGSVYVRIPAQGKGAGKVLVSQQNRTMEYEAFSVGRELPTGTQITVLKVISPTAVEVSEVR